MSRHSVDGFTAVDKTTGNSMCERVLFCLVFHCKLNVNILVQLFQCSQILKKLLDFFMSKG